MTRKRAFQLAVFAAFFFAVGFTYEYHLPQIESWLLLKIEEQAAKHSPVQVFPKRLRLSLFPLGVALEETRIVPKPGLDKTLAPTELKQVAIGINVFSLLRGEVRLSRVIFRDSTVTVFLKPELFAKKSGTKPGGPLSPDILKDLPVDEIQFENMTFMGRIDPQALVFKISELDLDLVNLYNSIYLYVGSPSWQFKPAGPYPTLNIEAQVRGLMDATELRISALKVKSDQSFVVASGLLNGDFLNASVNTGRFSLRTHVDLPDIANWVRVLPEPPSLPKMEGQLNLSTEIAYKGKGQKPDVDVALDTKGIAIDKFRLGDLGGKLAVAADSVSSENLHVHNEAGDIKFEDLHAKWTTAPQKKFPDISFDTTVGIEKIELRQFLENLGVKHVPIHLDVSAHAPCKGSYDGHLNVRCEGDIHGEELVVKNMSGKKTIVKAKQFHGKGFATVDENKVTYEAEARMSDKSTGRSKGVIDYDKGFKIDFEGDNLEFNDIQNLVDLKLEGSTKVKGSTEGDSSWATVTMNLQPKNFWLEDFGIGDFTTQMTYKSGHLYLQNIDGQYGVSRYTGNIDINLLEDTISLTNKMSYVDLKDLKSLLMRRLPIPIDLTGTGSGQITASGPLDIEKLNYHVTSNFYRGTIARETYDSLHFDVDGISGVAHTRRVQATKANGQLEMRGILKPAWSIDSVFVGRALRLEQSELISTLGLDLQGQTDFNVVLRGPIKKPHLELNGRLSKVIIADQPQEDSSFRLDINNARLTGSGSFLGNKIQSQVVYPFEAKNPFALEFKTNNWDFTNLFSLISKSANQSDFQTGLTMEAKLHSDEGGFWNSTGLIEVKDLHIRKGSETMKADGPMKLNFKNGVANSENFVISSGDNFLKLNVQNFSHDRLNADLNGKLNLGMLGLLTPFITDLRGNVALSVDMKGSAEKPQLSGSTFIDKAYVKLRDFPHPFSNLRADLLFNQQTLMINAFNGELGGGKITADGRISFIARDNVPVDIKGTFSDVALNIPDGYKSRGSGDIAIKGQKFPYLMGINYNITGGDLVAEFGPSNEQGTIKASPYLPKFVKEENFDPFQFDVKVDLVKPVQVSNSLLKAQVQGQAQIKGTPDHLLLTGNFSPLPGGKFMFHEQPFEIQTGYVEYANYPPENPRIYLTANAHVTQVVTDSQVFNQTPVGSSAANQAVPRQVENQYDISLLVQGRAQPMPQITFSSQPPLSQRDIVSLLALGMTSTALDEQKSSSSQATGVGAAGSALLQQPVGKKLKESLGVDMKVSTAPPTVSDPTAAPMVTFSKQWTPKFSSSASSTFGNSTTNGVKLEYKMNRNISVIGSWDNRDQSTTVFEDKKESGSIFGLDLEYRVNFK
jgi:translocation and assembly module TamB